MRSHIRRIEQGLGEDGFILDGERVVFFAEMGPEQLLVERELCIERISREADAIEAIDRELEGRNEAT